MKDSPLAGRGIVITRPREHAGALALLIERAGGRPIVFPTVEIADLPRPRVLDSLAEFDLAIFVSPTAALKGLQWIMEWPARVALAAVGAGTRKALQARGFEALAPESGADSEALLALPRLQAVAGQRIVIFRGVGGRELLGETLAKRGARVEYAACYRRLRPHADPAPLAAAWGRGEVHAVTAFSSEALANLVALAGEYVLQAPLFVPHPRIAQAARLHGAREVQIAGPGDEEMAARLVAYFEAR